MCIQEVGAYKLWDCDGLESFWANDTIIENFISDDTIIDNSVNYFWERYDILRQFQHRYDTINELKYDDLGLYVIKSDI